ncbi:MAG: hypothetical protein BGO98_00380 [Myxococcales bacterium 68-20]|mgnify:FL=1|nr:MAG: hypothetical protein BGO98_00380 [Myxococcales bacterium 68-20]
MRILGAAGLSLVWAGLFAVGCLDLQQGTDGEDGGATAADGGADSASRIVGGGCGTEQSTGAQLCIATSQCPNVVVDTQAMPGCGFRIRGGVVDLVCACGTAICPMGIFSTCAEAAQLLANQTEQGVCVQVAEGRCMESSSGSTSSSSSSGSSNGGNPACDRQCMKDCGGGEACATVCNCN